MDLNWCIENSELAIERLKEKQSQHSEWVANLNKQRKNKEELEGVYWKIREHQKKFDIYFNETISNLKDFDNLKDEHNKGGVKEEVFLHRQSQLNNKSTYSFGKIIEFSDEIENINKNYIEPEKDIIDNSYNINRELEITKKLESVECDKKINLIKMEKKLEEGKSEALQKKVSYALYELDAINSELSDERTIDRISKLSRYLETWTTE